MNLAEDNDGNIQGTLQVGFDQAVEASCVAGLNTTISGSVSGFNVSLTTGEGEEGGGSITFQLTSADNTLSGTYVTSGICSNFTGTGTVSLAR